MLRVKGWTKFQHYKDRRPPWIKLSRELLENYDWFRLQDASRSLAICIWLLAAENDDPQSGLISDDPEWLGFRARMEPKKVIEAVKDLVKYGFLEHVQTDASDLLAPCYQDATPETETEADNNKKGGEEKKTKIGLKELSVDHISEWLEGKRAGGKYLTIDEHRLLEMFKDYCTSKGRTYKDYIAGFRNAFEWSNAPRKGEENAKTRTGGSRSSKADRVKDSLYGDQSEIIDVTPST